MAAFLVGDSLETAWSTVAKNFWLCCGCVVGVFLVPGVSEALLLSFVDSITKGEANSWPLLKLVMSLAVFLLQSGLQVGILHTALKLLDKGEADLSDLLACVDKVPSYLLSTLVFMILVTVGFWLLLVPGIFLMMRLGFYPFLIVDKGMGPIEALKYSYEITKGSTWKLFGLLVMLVLIFIAGLLCLIVGLIPAAAMSVLAVAFTYRQLTTDKVEAVSR
jgi:uncharacterized membrane protein